MSKVLIVAEHNGQRLNQSTARCVTCALQIDPAGADIVVLGEHCASIASEAAALQGVARVLTVESAGNRDPGAAILAPQVVTLARDYDCVLGPSTTFGKDLMPRVAALLGVGQVSDLMAVDSPRRFRRPVYAGNAILTVEVPVLGYNDLSNANEFPGLDKVYIDVGATSKKNCPVQVGDVAAFDRPFTEMGNRLIAKSMDESV